MDAELTGSATARIHRERRSATVLLPPATIRSTGAVGFGLRLGVRGATMSVHDAM
jgi:hypothetical protein